MIQLVIATRNAHKATEIRTILGEAVHGLTLNDFPGAPITIEDAPTFAGNATKKAVELARWLGTIRPSPLPPGPSPHTLLAEDCGLEVRALAGAPGIFSPRLAASPATPAPTAEASAS